MKIGNTEYHIEPDWDSIRQTGTYLLHTFICMVVVTILLFGMTYLLEVYMNPSVFTPSSRRPSTIITEEILYVWRDELFVVCDSELWLVTLGLLILAPTVFGGCSYGMNHVKENQPTWTTVQTVFKVMLLVVMILMPATWFFIMHKSTNIRMEHFTALSVSVFYGWAIISYLVGRHGAGTFISLRTRWKNRKESKAKVGEEYDGIIDANCVVVEGTD